MIVREAKALARRWSTEEAGVLPGFEGAFLHGSINWLPDDAPLPAASDVDLIVVRAGAGDDFKLGKILYGDVILDVSTLPSDQLASPELILSKYHLAGSLRAASVLADPTGRLSTIQSAVARDFAKRRWVTRRCDHARDRVIRHLQSCDEATSLHDQVTAWLFANGVLTHILLVAGLRNPTVRRRYLAVRSLLADYGREEFYEALLDLLGCAQMTHERAFVYLAAVADSFDAAKAVIRSPFPFASDISDLARPIAIDGSRDLIAHGWHREAVFWLVATYSRCQKVLLHDAPPELRDRFAPGYQVLLGDIGIASAADVRQRCADIRAALPPVWEMSEAIIAANPDIDDE